MLRVCSSSAIWARRDSRWRWKSSNRASMVSSPLRASCQASREYLDYLEGLNISWITCGGDKIDLARACEILKEEFGVQRAAVVGGGHINAAFLADGLLDEVSILVGAGIDGRGGMAAVFDGLPMDRPVTPLKLTSVQQYGTGAVWLRYHTEK